MAEHAGESIPKACASWTDAMAAYRLLSNSDVDPHAVQAPHRVHTRKACASVPVVLAVSDITDLDFTGRTKITGLGRLGDGGGLGLQQHTTLAVEPGGGVIGVLRQHWYRRPEAPQGEARRTRQTRWCESDAWADAAREIGTLGAGCRVIHVADRGADIFGFLGACVGAGAGFLVRAVHDRRVQGEEHRLWEHALSGPRLDTMEVVVSAQRNGPQRDRRVARQATLTLRAAPVTIPPPVNDPRVADAEPLALYAVHALEEKPPRGQGIVPVEWMLLTSEPATTAQDARRLVGWYAQRWTVEEFHRVEKEGCRLESSQLDDAHDIQRLAAITAVVAVRLLQLRDAADPHNPRADEPALLRGLADEPMIRIVAALAQSTPRTITPRQFWRTVANRGGWLGRSSDPRPGWKCLWRGWHDIALMALGAALIRPDGS
jgi:Transposase DNA-binding